MRHENETIKTNDMETMKFKLDGDWTTKAVYLNGKHLSPVRSQKIRNHSPDGFNWGYGGSGPAQLALAVLLALMPEEEAAKEYQNFKFKVISMLPQADFEAEIEYSKDKAEAEITLLHP